jgi:hypothetical protein
MSKQLYAHRSELEEARCFALTFKSQLSIRLHKSLTPKGILNSHLGLCILDVCHKTETIFMTKRAKGKPVECSSLISSIVCMICLHKQKSILMIKAYRILALLSTSSLRRVMGHILCKTIFASRRCEEENAPILMS